MVELSHKSRLPEHIQEDLISQVIAGAIVRTETELVDLDPHTTALYSHKLGELIVSKLTEKEAWLSGEITVGRSDFGCSRIGNRGYGAAGKVPVFGLLKLSGKVQVVIILNTE